jgi:gliding motility-associated-like protein
VKAIGIFFCFLCLNLIPASSQKMYISQADGQGIQKVSVTSAGCTTKAVTVCPNENYFAMALFGNKLYYATNAFLYEGTLQNDILTNCHVIDFTPVAMSSMTVDNTGILYMANTNALYKWDPASGAGVESLGSMPYSSAGDMIFYLGDLYMASTQGIVKVNIANPPASTMHIPMNAVSVYGMAVLSVDCNQNKAYAFETINAGANTNIIELDLVNRTIVGTVCTIPYGVADAASEVEGGTFAGISLEEIKILPQCQEPGKGQIRVIREPGQAEYTYTLNGTIINNTGVFEHLDPGNYEIEITTPGGCYLDTLVDVPLFNPVIPVVDEHHTAPDCISAGKVWFTIVPDNGNNKIIYNNDTLSSSFQFTDLNEGLHHFSIVDEYFCEIGSKDILLSLDGSCDTLYFPSAFTPNNDGKNDVFKGLGNRSVRDYKLTVYNRWGQKVFSTNNVLQGWNGRIRDGEQYTGIYIWVASYTNTKGEQRNRKGTVVLLR